MNLDNQIVTLLARKAQLRDEVDTVERQLGQLTAIKQFTEAQPAEAPAPEAAPEQAPEVTPDAP